MGETVFGLSGRRSGQTVLLLKDMLPMRRLSFSILLASAVLASASVRSAEAELGTDLMQAVDDSNKSLASNIAQKDAKGSISDAKDINQAFIQVEAFFAAKPDAHDAVELSRKTRELTDVIVKAVGEGRFDAAQDFATELSRTCRTCHTFYKKS